MGYKLREIEEGSKFSRELSVDSLSQVVPVEEVKAALLSSGIKEQRERKLNMVVVVFIVIGMGLYEHLSIGKVLGKLAKGLRYIWPDADYKVAGDSAINYRRQQLGVGPMVELFQRVCRPLASEETAGAFLFGLRLMAIDGTTEDIADRPENEAVFGRHRGGRGASAYPQMRGVYLVECGTHAIVDGGFWPLSTGEQTGAMRMLRTVTVGMLVMWDAGLHSYDMLNKTRTQGGHALGRLPAHVSPEHVLTLSDGSSLAYLSPSDYQRRRRGERILVRIISYTLTDPALPGYGQTYRLVTTLLSPQSAPALDIVCAYHERWEIELVIDEIDTHQRLTQRPFRSKTPRLLLQEAYGLLLAHFIIRYFIFHAAASLDLDPDRLSFTHALEVVRDAVDQFQMTACHQLDLLYHRLLRDIASVRLPLRRFRSNPRVVKRKMAKFLKKRPEHQHPPQPQRPFRDSVLLI